MSAVGGMLGFGGGASGTGFATPQGTNILQPASVQQATDQYNNAQLGLDQQQNLISALAGVNGIGNQQNVYSQLANVAAGNGPNPAKAMLANATAANTANQAALMAGQRGSDANVGLIARQAAQQGAANQQNSAGQAAALQANQSLGALQSMGNLANQQVANQMNSVGAYNQYAQGEQSNILNSIAAQNNANVGLQSNINSSNASMANTKMGQQGSMIGGMLGGIGSAFGLAEGGEVPSGDSAPTIAPSPEPATPVGPQSKFGKFAKGFIDDSSKNLAGSDTSPGDKALNQGANQFGKGLGNALKGLFSSAPTPMAGGVGSMIASGAALAAHGGQVPAMVSPGERYLSPKKVEDVKKGADPMKIGEKIPGKAKVNGDSYSNDIVPKTLQSGGIVIPRHITQSKNAPDKAKEFVAAVLARKTPVRRGKK